MKSWFHHMPASSCRHTTLPLAILAVLAWLPAQPCLANLPQIVPLRFSLAAPTEAGSPCGHDGQPSATESPAPPTGTRAAQGPAKSGKPAPRFEFEHRPTPLRTYFLNNDSNAAELDTVILHPDGVSESLGIERQQDKNTQVSFRLPMADGPGHGAHNIYATEKKLAGDTLLVRSAKWLTIQHSCGWGHEWKFDEQRQTALSLAEIPLEIVVDKLWDPNFHSTVMSGDTLSIRVLAHGEPAVGATITVSSEKGWSKTLSADAQGRATVQLIRDYYPISWLDFKRTTPGEVLITAQYEEQKSGTINGAPYSRISHLASFPWRYYPARGDYSSYSHGLLAALAGMSITGFGFVIHRRRKNRGLRKLPW